MYRQQQQVPQQQPGVARPTDFREIAQRLAPELVEKLDEEHRREVEILYQEQFTLREELTRVVDLMTREIVPRERMLHQMIEQLQSSYEDVTQGLHQQLTDHINSSKSKHAEHKAHRETLINPLNEMEAELGRIQRLLNDGILTPQIQGWQPKQPQPFLQQQQQQQAPMSPPVRSPPGGTGGTTATANFGMIRGNPPTTTYRSTMV